MVAASRSAFRFPNHHILRMTRKKNVTEAAVFGREIIAITKARAPRLIRLMEMLITVHTDMPILAQAAC